MKTQMNENRNHKKKIWKDSLLRLPAYAALVLIAVYLFFPFFVLITRAFMTTKESMAHPVAFFPKGLNWESFQRALSPEFLQYSKNTLFVILCNIIGVPLTATMSAYAFTKLKFKGRDTIFKITLATIMVPGIVTAIPTYILFVKLGWNTTLLPLTVPAFLGGGALNIFLIMQFMRGLPRELDEAARVEGANPFQILFKITAPLCRPVILLTGVQTFLGVWNDFMSPLMYLDDPEKYTLPVGVYNMFFNNTVAAQDIPNVQMATGVLLIIPPLILFSIFQKQLMEGIALTGVKA